METRHPKSVRAVLAGIPLLAALLTVACAQLGSVGSGKSIPADRLVELNGLYYAEDSTNNAAPKPFTGSIEAPHSATNKQRRLYAEVRDGKLDGQATLWHESGKKHLQVKYDANTRVRRIEWDDKGKLISEYPDPKTKSTAAVQPPAIDPSTGLPYAQPPTGTNQPPTTVTNAPPAAVLVLFPLLKLKLRGSLYYESDEALIPFTGVGIEYHSGKIKKREEHFVDGERRGRATWWYKNGVKSYEAFLTINIEVPSNSLPNGTVTHWFPTGKLKKESIWKDRAEIKVTTYNPDGQPNGTLEGGNGTLVHYDEAGKKQHEETYENGALKSEQWYAADGKLVP